MSLRLWRLSSVMSTAVTMAASVAHLLEMPAKMRYEPSLYVRLHRTLYNNFGRFAGPAEILSVLITAGLAWRLKAREPAAFPPTAAAAACLAAAHGVFWALVHPANKTIGGWDLQAIPPEWAGWRNQWEYTHAVRAVLVTCALAMIVWSELPENRGAATQRLALT